MFISKDFTYDGISAESLGLQLVGYKDVSDVLNEYGVNFSSDINGVSNRNISIIYDETHNTDDITLYICKCDENDIPQIWEDKDILMVYKWLNKKSYKPFISDDNESLTYYSKCIGIKKLFNFRKEGLLEVVMRLNSPYGYLPLEKYVANTNQDRAVISIDNQCNIDGKKIYPIIDITYTPREHHKLIQDGLLYNIVLENEGEINLIEVSSGQSTDVIIETEDDRMVSVNATDNREVTLQDVSQVSLLKDNTIFSKDYSLVSTLMASQDNEIITDVKKSYVIVNNMNNDEDPLVIEGLIKDEKVEINCDLKSIKSSIGENRLNSCNRKWIYLNEGINNIEIIGRCNISIAFRFPVLV